MRAIFKREFRAYFTSPLGYIYLAAVFVYSGILFYINNLQATSTDMRPLFVSLCSAGIILIPILTMRLFSEDKKLKTDQALLTAPITLSELVLGKFLSSFALYLCGSAITLVYALFMSAFSSVSWSMVLGCFVGYALSGAALIAVGMFISVLTENQMIAAIASFVASLFLLTFFDTLVKQIPMAGLRQVLLSLSVVQNFANFTIGVIDIASVVFFVSFAALFIFFTVRIIDKRRWS